MELSERDRRNHVQVARDARTHRIVAKEFIPPAAAIIARCSVCEEEGWYLSKVSSGGELVGGETMRMRM